MSLTDESLVHFTMTAKRFITPDNVLSNVQGRSKKHCLEILSELLARSTPGIANEEIFAKLVERERLGCTSLDDGIAFPHCRLGGVEGSSAALVKLAEPIEFDSPDGELVDLVFGLVVPQDIGPDHRAEIAEITGLLNDPALRERLRQATSSRGLYEAFVAGNAEARLRPQSVRKA
ncbi:MAG: PTS sugar transporter subunit IIA [Woeseia sp.]